MRFDAKAVNPLTIDPFVGPPRPPLSLDDELKFYLNWFAKFYYSRGYDRRRITDAELRKREQRFRELAAEIPQVEEPRRIRERADYFRSLLLPEGGRPAHDFDECWCVFMMIEAYKRHGHAVTAEMLDAVPELKKPKDQRAWAKDRYKTWTDLEADFRKDRKKTMDRVRKERARLEIL